MIAEQSRIRLDRLNALCPYYTMYPLSFPVGILSDNLTRGTRVLDPFCGRGTTNYAARLLGYPSTGLDTSPIAVAIAKSKLARASSEVVIEEAENILQESKAIYCPDDDFWRVAYHPKTLNDICRLRRSLLKNCHSNARIMLRAILLGALHGPRTKADPSYLSNQSPRTFAPKPRYAVSYWKKHKMRAPEVDVLALIRRKADYYLSCQARVVSGSIHQIDSRDKTFS